MIVEDQSEVVALLSRPETFGAGVDTVDRVETHVSLVFMGGDRVLKLKRAVKLPYLDFSTAGLRRGACEAEVAINRRTAPHLYRGVVAVTREAGDGLALSGTGPAVDWLVDMARFDEDTLFDRLARRGALDRTLMEDLADAIASFHGEAEPRPDRGGAAATAAIIANNAQCFAQCADGILDDDAVVRLNAGAAAAVARLAPALDRRREALRVRHCHGDLHLRNIFLDAGRPTLFDAIEFDPALADIDVAYDLAFLLMDLDHRGLRDLANVVLNRYLDLTADGGGLEVLPLFLSMRAAIRCHVDATAAGIGDRDEAAALAAEAAAYLEKGLAYLAPPPPRLVAIGGLSGSGKSRLARVVAPDLGAAPGARIARSDVLRKRLAGVGSETRLGAEGYTPEMTERTYAAVYDEVRESLAAGHAVVADAVFARPEERDAIAAVADAAGVPFAGLWLEAPAAAMETRIRERRRNASDATPEVMRRQLDYDVGEMTWTRIDSGGSREATVAAAREALGL